VPVSLDARRVSSGDHVFRDSSGAVLTIGKKLGEGGEGVVFTTHERSDIVAKIYSRPLTPVQIAKLEQMVHAADEALGSVAAWPVGMLYKGATPVGFTMPRLSAQQPLHDLFGPRRRQALFPNAHWSFLVHTGINVSRAFEVLHDRNVIVGDVNSNNVVVFRDATARLIDCDSFQFRTKNTIFRCNVGVAEYQPPELQGGDFSRIERLPQHDLFGLAVMIFQLLFVGKHPFAGVLPSSTSEVAPIGENVAAKRFFYGHEGQRQGLRPPPGSLTLTAITPQLSTLFKRAFVGDPARRPNAAAWRMALTDLKAKTVVCRGNPLHHYLKGTSCPWCDLEGTGLYYFNDGALASGYDEQLWQGFTDADVERLWSEVESIAPPPPVDPTIEPTGTYEPKPISLWLKHRRRSYRDGAIIAAAATVGLLLLHKPWIAMGVAMVALLVGFVFRPDARAVAAQRSKRHSEARRVFRLAERDWNRAATNARFNEERDRLARIRSQLLGQRARYASELAGLEKNRERKERNALLARHKIAACNIPEITWQTQSLLRAWGIETAADVTFNNLERVPGLWRPAKYYLLSWRQTVERKLNYKPKKGLDPEIVREFKTAHARERAENQAQLAAGPALLRQIAADTARQRPALEKAARQAAEVLWEAQADDNISPLFYWTTFM
jgi:DNA-binding helix-hairpin-helix protein with protein kinase domain